MRFTAKEIASVVAARLAQEYPAAVFDAGPQAAHSRINQQTDYPGGRIVMIPGKAGPGTRILYSMIDEVRADLEVLDFECFGYDPSVDAKWLDHFDRAQSLGDIVARALFPYTTRIKFLSGEPKGLQQMPVVGAVWTVSYAVLRPVGAWATPATVAADLGAPDVDSATLVSITPSIEVTR